MGYFFLLVQVCIPFVTLKNKGTNANVLLQKKSYVKIVFTKENNLAEINQINFILSAEFIFTDLKKKKASIHIFGFKLRVMSKNNVQEIVFFT